MAKRNWGILPLSDWGKWSIGLIVVMPLLLILGMTLARTLYVSVPAGETILADITARPALALSMLAGFGAGIVAFIAGLLAMIRRKDRSLLVILATVIGALVVVYLAAEILFAH